MEDFPWISVKEAWPPLNKKVFVKEKGRVFLGPAMVWDKDIKPWFTHWCPFEWLGF